MILDHFPKHLCDWQQNAETTPLRLRGKKQPEDCAPIADLPTPHPVDLDANMNDRTVG